MKARCLYLINISVFVAKPFCRIEELKSAIIASSILIRDNVSFLVNCFIYPCLRARNIMFPNQFLCILSFFAFTELVKMIKCYIVNPVFLSCRFFSLGEGAAWNVAVAALFLLSVFVECLSAYMFTNLSMKCVSSFSLFFTTLRF